MIVRALPLFACVRARSLSSSLSRFCTGHGQPRAQLYNIEYEKNWMETTT